MEKITAAGYKMNDIHLYELERTAGLKCHIFLLKIMQKVNTVTQ